MTNPPPVPGYPPPRPTTPAGLPIAGFGERLAAYLIDSAVMSGIASIVLVPVFVVVLLVMVGARAGSTALTITFLALFGFGSILILGLGYAYHVVYVARTGSTLGKKLMKLRIVLLDDGAAPGRPVLAKRWAAQYLVGLLPMYGYLDGFWQLWDQPYRQCLHDKWPRTAVVKVSA